MHWVFFYKNQELHEKYLKKKPVCKSHTENISEEISDAPRHLQTVAW